MQQKECKHKLKCIHCQRMFTSLQNQKQTILDYLRRKQEQEQEGNETYIIYLRIPQPEKKGFLRKLWSWIW